MSKYMPLIKTPDEIQKIRAAGKILARVLEQLKSAAQEGITLKDLDVLAEGLIKKAGAEPAFLGYRPDGADRPYPATLCASLNNVIVHGVPTAKKRLKSGDLLKLDLGVRYQGYCADAALTLAVDNIDGIGQKMIVATQEALKNGIQAARAGNTLGDIGFAIKKTTESYGFKIIKGLTGHGIGEKVHEEPSVYNEGDPGKGLKLKAGMVLAIEPMISAGSDQIKQLKDESYATIDNSLAAHFEHTIVITDGAAEILTMI